MRESHGTLGHRTAAFEHARRAVTPVPTMKKPFDVLAEGLISKNSRGDKTAIELFQQGLAGWDAGLRRVVDNGTPLQE